MCHCSEWTSPETGSEPSDMNTEVHACQSKSNESIRIKLFHCAVIRPDTLTHFCYLFVIFIEWFSIVSVKKCRHANNFFLFVDDGEREDILDRPSSLVHGSSLSNKTSKDSKRDGGKHKEAELRCLSEVKVPLPEMQSTRLLQRSSCCRSKTTKCFQNKGGNNFAHFIWSKN